MKIKAQLKYYKEEVTLKKNLYNNGRICLRLVDSEGGPVATCTVNLPEEELADDKVIIKDYSENEGMLLTLFDAGIIDLPYRQIHTGFVTVQVAKLKINLDDI